MTPAQEINQPTNPKTRTIREWQADVHLRNRLKGFYDYEHDLAVVEELFEVLETLAPQPDTDRALSALCRILNDYRRAIIERKLLLVIGEVCEAHEELRAGHDPAQIYRNDGSDKPEGVPIELADAQIRLLDVQAACGNDSESAIALKHEFNGTRPHKHEKAF